MKLSWKKSVPYLGSEILVWAFEKYTVYKLQNRVELSFCGWVDEASAESEASPYQDNLTIYEDLDQLPEEGREAFFMSKILELPIFAGADIL